MPDLVLRASTLIDGTGADPCYDAEVVMSDGLITYAGPARPLAGDAEVVDYGDATLMPGLIDCHCPPAVRRVFKPRTDAGRA